MAFDYQPGNLAFACDGNVSGASDAKGKAGLTSSVEVEVHGMQKPPRGFAGGLRRRRRIVGRSCASDPLRQHMSVPAQ
jgi:hypothetical protein